MRTNQDGIALLKSFEGCELDAYQDVAGIWTIGYGSTGDDVVEGLSWTQEQADERLANDLIKFETGVSSCVKVLINDNEFSALVCFSYNVGTNALRNSTLLKKLNLDDRAGAADQFLAWDKARVKGVLQPVAGLTRRRHAERELFLKASSDSTNGDLLPDGPSEDEIMVKLKDNE